MTGRTPTVWHCRQIPNGPSPIIVCEREQMQNEIEALRQWKREATEVIAAWDDVWAALGCPGQLGESKAQSSLRAVLHNGSYPEEAGR